MPPSLSNFNMDLLVPLHALLMERSVTKAAERVEVTQPSMSTSLAKLRRHFNEPLLVRDGRRMVLTPFAESLVQPVTEMLEAIREVVGANAAFDPTTDRRVFTVTASDYVAIVLLRPLLREIDTAYPHVQIKVAPLNHGMVDQLRRGQCDLVIWPPMIQDKELETFSSATLFTDEFVAVVDQDHPEVGDVLTSDQLCTLPYVQIGGPQPTIADTVLAQLGLPLRAVAATDNFTNAACLLPGTRMVAVIQRRLFDQLGPSIGLRTVALDVPLPRLVESMYWHPRNTIDPAHRWLRERVLSLCATDLPDRPHGGTGPSRGARPND
ncbi:LysR family transcriptional regulator [Streptomyces asiaticus]